MPRSAAPVEGSIARHPVALALLVGHGALFRASQAPSDLLPLVGDCIVPYALGLPALLLAMGANGASGAGWATAVSSEVPSP